MAMYGGFAGYGLGNQGGYPTGGYPTGYGAGYGMDAPYLGGGFSGFGGMGGGYSGGYGQGMYGGYGQSSPAPAGGFWQGGMGGPKPDFPPPFNGAYTPLGNGMGIRQMAPSTLPPSRMPPFNGSTTDLGGGMAIRQMGPTQLPPGFNPATSQWQPEAVNNTSGFRGIDQIRQEGQQARAGGYSDRYGIDGRFNGQQFDRAGAVNDYYSQLAQIAQRTGRGGQQVNLFELNNQNGEYTGPMNMAMINELNGGYWKPGAMGSFTGVKDGQHYFLGNPISEYYFNENFKTGLPGA